MITWTKLTIIKLTALTPDGIRAIKNKKVDRIDVRLETGNAVDGFMHKVPSYSSFKDPHVKLTLGDNEFFVSISELEQALAIAKSGAVFTRLDTEQ